MAYTKQTWANESAGGTPVSAARLNYMEAGIEGAHASPYSEAYVPGGTLLNAGSSSGANYLRVQSNLVETVTDPAHTFAADGITVPAGAYLVTCEALWSTAENVKRCPGVHDGTRFHVLEGLTAGYVTNTAALAFQEITYTVTLAASAKLAFAFLIDATSTNYRTIASGTNTKYRIRRIA